ncbi:MAG: uroporphyrinogen-III synthase [Bryobacterales bacterium]|nr:uroporphyrinogen-III synthase [Bryobacteraceae bacterium]MDW8130883.1 uroporphyrinogen-III synthase [Bryobacterales bacterium]
MTQAASKPLAGRRVVVTRPAQQADALLRRLRDLGAEPVELPAIEVRPPEDWMELDVAIARLHEYDWILFTSANGVRFFLERLDASPLDARAIQARICAIGPATRKALEEAHLKPDLVPAEYVAESIVSALSVARLEGRRILLPRAAGARDFLPEQLRQRGAQVDVIEAYRTVAPADLPEKARQIFGGHSRPHWVTFTSSSTVRNLVEAVGADALRGVRIASIGPITSATVRSCGLQVTAEARVYTSEGLVEAIVAAEEAGAWNQAVSQRNSTV